MLGSPRTGEGGKKNLRVIVVEDNDDDAELLIRELKRVGYVPHFEQVDTPARLREVLARENVRWDIVISDWNLPAFNGLEAFGIVKETNIDIPFIIVSGTIGEENAIEALKAGVHDFMTKGRFARLLPAIERELRDAEMRRQKRATEEDLDRQREETAKSERLLRSVLQTVPDGVVVLDTKGSVVEWSASADRILGKTRSEKSLEEWPAHYGLYLPDRHTPLPYKDLAIVRAGNGDEVDRQELFIRNENIPKGHWASVSARALRSTDGSVAGVVAVFHDLSKEKVAQEQLMISDRMASVGMLAAGVAHEINNPLGAALLNLEIVTELMSRPQDKRDDGEVKDSIGDARAAVARVREIVGDLKIFSRPEEATMTSGASVRDALESSLRMAFNEVRHRARVVKDYAPTPAVNGSEARLGQVFLNLIVNAAQAIPEGRIDENTIRITTRTDKEGRAVVEVADTGSGIPAEHLPNLFAPFFTTKPVGIGTGLGLPICQRIVMQMGGTIEVESEVGKGTTFRVTIPPSTIANARPIRPSRTLAAVSQRRGRVLVVDDEPMLASAIRRVLARDHDVVTTTRAEDALEKLRTGSVFDVIFSDLMMPQVTGMELYARICKEFPDQAPRVVFLTGGAFTQAAREFLATVPNPTLEKPIDRHGLLALVSERVKSPTIPPPNST